jgi:hypothetical protein
MHDPLTPCGTDTPCSHSLSYFSSLWRSTSLKNPTQFYITRQNKNKPWGTLLRNKISIFDVKTPERVIHTGTHFLEGRRETPIWSDTHVVFVWGRVFCNLAIVLRNEMNMKILWFLRSFFMGFFEIRIIKLVTVRPRHVLGLHL